MIHKITTKNIKNKIIKILYINNFNIINIKIIYIQI